MQGEIYDKLILERARRTAFISRFIVLREGKKSKAHRKIEMLEWSDSTSTEYLLEQIRNIFEECRDNMATVDRDLRRALAHADRLNPLKSKDKNEIQDSHFSLWPLIEEYNKRACNNFIDALFDYERSNKLLFGEDGDQPKLGGWRLPRELLKGKSTATPKDVMPVTQKSFTQNVLHQ